MYYCSFGDLQNEFTSYYRRTGRRIQFPEAMESLYNKGMLSSSPLKSDVHFKGAHTDTDEFESVIDDMCFPVISNKPFSENVIEADIIPQLNDVFIIRHTRYTRPELHRHDYVEMDYVVRGSFTLHFEDEIHKLEAGDFCLVAPTSRHDVEVTDESVVYCIMLRRSTFQSSFFSLLSRDDILSSFFRTMLTGLQSPNYMILHADNEEFMRIMAQSLMLECHNQDSYTNSCCISLVHMMLACLLRSENLTPRFYKMQSGTSDFAGVLQYIRANYHTVTLADLAREFHYSKPHLCTLIRNNTGTNFSSLIRQIRMDEAKEYLIKTNLPIAETAEIVGYNSADHFSRVFRGAFGMSPQEYRRINTPSEGQFVPFQAI